MTLEEKARKIYEHFGKKDQELKQIEEQIEISIALLSLAKFYIKTKDLENYKETEQILIYNCNDELADNVFLRMQLTGADFEKCYDLETEFVYNKQELENHYLTNFTFDKETVRRIAEEKAIRTMSRYNIG